MKYTVMILTILWSIAVSANPRLVVDFDLAGRAAHEDPSLAPQNRFTLSRAQTGLSIFPNQVMSGHIRLQAIRSAPENGYVGLQGESFITRALEAYAQLQWQLGDVHTSVAAGLIPTPWVLNGNESFGFRAVSPIASESIGALFRSDTGLLARAGYLDAVQLHVGATSGEGLAYRERNDDKNLMVHLDISPLRFLDYGLVSTLRVEMMFQHGTQGMMSTTANRLGARLSGGAEWLYGGLEWMQIDGLADDPNYTPLQMSAWIRTYFYGPLVLLSKIESTDHLPEQSDATERNATIAMGVDQKPIGTNGRWQLLAGMTHTTRDINARTLAGEGLLSNTRSFWLLIGIQSEWDSSYNGGIP